jgi:hypothetical protein
VQATLVEALIIAVQLSPRQFKKVEEYVQRQKEIMANEKDFLAILRKERTLLGPCPFLNARGCCSIYAQRPLACRALLSTKDSAWCSVDFQSLAPLEKHLYLQSLDHAVVTFPVHYVAGTQRLAQEGEKRLLLQMQKLSNETVSGNFPLLVYLAFTLTRAGAGKDEEMEWQRELFAHPFFHPLLIRFDVDG